VETPYRTCGPRGCAVIVRDFQCVIADTGCFHDVLVQVGGYGLSPRWQVHRARNMGTRIFLLASCWTARARTQVDHPYVGVATMALQAFGRHDKHLTRKDTSVLLRELDWVQLIIGS
jgi:hypothetical protein